MPRPIEDHGRHYVAGLDGLRTLAVSCVFAYHLGVPAARGGLLGVGVFFTLSGFLITGILLRGWQRRRSLGLGQFWLRRARRLLPAVVVLLAVVLLTTVLADRGSLGTRLSESLAGLFYFANWRDIVSGDSYFKRFTADEGPLDHLWSLSVEEQFYLVWPLLFGLAIVLLRGRWRGLAVVAGALAAVSFVSLYTLADPLDTTRAYEGTDTRAGGLLIGAALAALLFRGNDGVRSSPRMRRLADPAGVVGLLGIGFLVVTADSTTMSLYEWGLLALSVATCGVLWAVMTPGTLVGKVLGWAPLRWLGERSYGIYLWHMPVIVFANQVMPGRGIWVTGAFSAGITVALAATSWAWFEDPIRRHGFLYRRSSVGRGRFEGTLMPDGRGRVRGTHRRLTAPRARVRMAAFVPAAALVMVSPHLVAFAVPRQAAPAPRAVAHHEHTAPVAFPRPTKSRCTSLTYIGDSLSLGMADGTKLPTSQELPAQLRKFGVTNVDPEIAGARSIIEPYEGQPTARDIVTQVQARGFDGCWVVALGTNDVANQVVQKSVPSKDRIVRLMNMIGDKPVLWLTVRTLQQDGPYADGGYQKWNRTLQDVAGQYPNMRVYDWASEVDDGWYRDDQIHFTASGLRQRASRIARAVAIAFPKRGQSPRTLIRVGN